MSDQSHQNKMHCPNCQEPIKDNWNICPACETALTQLTCPKCDFLIKSNWKRCPECETRLFCPVCHIRIPHGSSGCTQCTPHPSNSSMQDTTFTDPVTGMEFVYVPGGTFMMGDGLGNGHQDEIPVHEICLSGYYFGKYSVTQSQWQRIMKNNPSRFQKGNNFPVEQVSWQDAQVFIEKITHLNKSKFNFCLPTEAQWEYAARSGGKDEIYAGGNEIEGLAWYRENSKDQPHPAGKKRPNGLGIFDMSGNVWEWCQDTYAEDSYANHQKNNPVFNEDGTHKVIRGGSWNTDSWNVRCTRRFSFTSDYFAAGLGFRLVMKG